MPSPNGPRIGGQERSHWGIGAVVPVPAAPLPGQHLPGPIGRPEPADPDRIRAEIDSLLVELDTRTPTAFGETTADGSGTDITRRAHILEQAHEVLVQALATVDKI